MTDKIIGMYDNGNYRVIVFDDGSKLRYNKEDTLIPERPESMDIKITNYCDMNCPYCHENSNIDGSHADILDQSFIYNLKPYTELAIGGGNPLSHPQLISFLTLCKNRKLIPSITVNQTHFINDYDTIKMLVDNKLIYGIGISITKVTNKLIDLIKTLDNAVVHVIAGVISNKDLEKLYDNNLKILILGYKTFRRGEQFYSNNIQNKINHMKEHLFDIVKRFKTVSFDNLAIKQLDVKNIISDWDRFYMGNDGQFTMYLDMINKEFAVGSTSTKRYKYTDETIEQMFSIIRS